MLTKMLLYCTKAKPELYSTDKGFVLTDFGIGEYYQNKCLLNGKIVGECDFEVEKIYFQDGTLDQAELGILGFRTKSLYEEDILSKSCLSYKQLNEYLRDSSPYGYAIHIKNLIIFDEPRELSEYLLTRVTRGLTYGFYNTYEIENERSIVIAVTPQEAYNILNDMQTTIVKREILKEMLKDE